MSLGSVVNSSTPENAPHLTPDQQHLLFASSRSGDFDIYVSRRRDLNDDLGWETPTSLPAPINGPSLEVGPSYFQNPGGRPQLYFASDRGNGLGLAGADIYMSELQSNGTWTAPTPVA